MFLRLQKTNLVLILLFRFSSRSIAYNLFSSGFTPIGLDQGANQSLFLYTFGLVGFGFTRQLCKQTNGLHGQNYVISSSRTSCMFLYFTLIGLLAIGHLMSAGWEVFRSLLVCHNFPIFRWHCSQVLLYPLSFILFAINLKVLAFLCASQAHFVLVTGNSHWFWPNDISVKAPWVCGFTLPCQLKQGINFKCVSPKKKIVELTSRFHT